MHHARLLVFLIFFIPLHFSPPIAAVTMVYTLPYNAHRLPGELPMCLTYAFLQETPISYLSQNDVESAFARAFATWSSVIPVSFEKVPGNSSDVDLRIGFFRGYHGDDHPFDGKHGELAHTWMPPLAKMMHFDADERWAVNFDKDGSKDAYDLQSVVAHETGHLLGLGHSNYRGAIMSPTIQARMKRVDLTIDDVVKVLGLYGPDPDFNPDSLHLSSSSGKMSLSRFSLLLASMVFLIKLVV